MVFEPGEQVIYILPPSDQMTVREWTAGLAKFAFVNAEGVRFVDSTMTQGWTFPVSTVLADTPANRRRAKAFVARANAEWVALLERQAAESAALG